MKGKKLTLIKEATRGLAVWPVLFFFVLACHNARAPAPTDSMHAALTPVADVYPKIDTGNSYRDNKTKVAQADSSAVEDEDENPQQIYDECIARYTARCVIDSSFRIGSESYRLHTEHVCLMDSGICVPKNFLTLYKLDSFVTHNFVTKVRLDKNNHTILQDTIVRKDFDPVLFPQLRKYAILFCPDLLLDRGKIVLGYSISIPLTDVGTAAYAVIDSGGRVSFKGEQPAQ